MLGHLNRLPGVARVGLALTEGAGRRLRFVAGERGAEVDLAWCHIDAYDDVPLTTVVRSGAEVVGSLDELEARYAGVVARQREEGTRALATLPLPGPVAPVGGLIVFFDVDQTFPAELRHLLETAARRTSEAVRRIRATRDGHRADTKPDDPALTEETHRASLRLPNDPRSAGEARRFLRVNLVAWGVDEVAIDSAELCLSELVNNVIMHAHTPAELTVHLEDGSLGVLVRDGGDAPREDPTVPEDEDPLRISGRGLTLIDALADRWGTHHDEQGTIAWFVLSLEGDGDGDARTG